MKIIILGAGQVGRSVAQNLVNEATDITIVDNNPELAESLTDELDISTIVGNASHPSILQRAGADDADMIVAVTNSDETNMIACQVASTLFQTPTKIARVRATDYLAHGELFHPKHINVDHVISPEQLVTENIRNLIEYPGALQVLEFADGRLRLVSIIVSADSPLAHQELKKLHEHLPGIQTRVAAIFRKGEAILPKGSTVVEADDELFFIATRQDLRKMINELQSSQRRSRRIILAGGGNIGYNLARQLEKDYYVKLIEFNGPRAHKIAESLDKTIVLHGDASDKDLLQSENIANVDIFCAVTNNDQANILSAMLAKHLGAKKNLAIVNRASYLDVVSNGLIDVVVNPQQTTIGTILAHVRRGDIVKVHSLRHGAAEAIEAIAHGDKNSSQVVGRTIEDIDLPKGVSIGAIVRGDQVLMPHHDTLIESNDHVILFVTDKSLIPQVDRIFQVSLLYF